MTEVRRSRVSGIDRAIQVLDCLVNRGAPATAYDIAKDIGAPVSTIYVIIDTLVERGLLTRRPETGAVFLGSKLHFYGLAYVRDLNIAEVFQRAMEELSRIHGETVQICGRDGDRMVVQMMEEAQGYFRIASQVGTRVPLNWTASGRLLVGHMSPEERARIFARAMPSPTGRAETDPARLEAACRKAWQERLSIQLGEADYAVACIAAPIRTASGECIATISMVVPETRAAERAAVLADAVRDAALKIEDAMGWRRGGASAPTAAEASAAE
ncbi:IclR family transcriptional regulator [Arenibaculum pallidiluteum]|uniref:IclR family transcriptional regulator n=1 Tax=Arenibaculum pallidiluteum TaxID=2812559 RepID=UPI001A9606E5|nr:IclR family transcriptional regulator [Arenibaculum pallidiluteum]